MPEINYEIVPFDAFPISQPFATEKETMDGIRYGIRIDRTFASEEEAMAAIQAMKATPIRYEQKPAGTA